jgi:hypothetical protein
MELAVMFAACAALGALRPRWTSLLVAVVPASLACLGLFLHEDIPGYRTDLGDVAWYVGMSLGVGTVFALVCAGGVVSGRALRDRRTRPPH